MQNSLHSSTQASAARPCGQAAAGIPGQVPGQVTDPGHAAESSQLQQQADITWQSMRRHGIAPTPNNYKVWFAFCHETTPELKQRLGAVLQAGGVVMPELLTDLYHEFFDGPSDLIAVRDSTQNLHQIAGELITTVNRNGTELQTVGDTLTGVLSDLGPMPSTAELERATTVISSITAQAGNRVRALEQLFAASVIKIVDLRERLVKAERDATRDALTGLFNRRMFDAVLARAAEQAMDDRRDLSLLMLDIDHFKRFNDTYGHVIGDNVLRLFGRLLLDHIKGRDTAARFGGEEFAVILPGASLAGARSVAEQIREALGSRPIMNRTSGQRLGVVTCSVGVAQFRHGEAVGDLIQRADQALYAAKYGGRNTVRTEA
ncbi:MAG TPA: GGDEF domain-containing protein [Rhodopila sp.]|nr:GGDEF domain-containing protein [Rhodopila sp.]